MVHGFVSPKISRTFAWANTHVGPQATSHIGHNGYDGHAHTHFANIQQTITKP